MKTKYFGIDISGIGYFSNARDIASRLFLCPRISPEHAIRLLEKLMEGIIPVEGFIAKTNVYIEELTLQKNSGTDNHQSMKSKLEEWKKKFDVPSDDDYRYIEKTFGFSRKDLFGEDEEMMSAKEMASYVKSFIKGQDEAIDMLAVHFFLHLDSKRKRYTSRIKTPVLLMGPTGVGKSEMLRLFGSICNCPVIRINSSEVVPSAWKGLHISDIIAREISEDVTVEDLEYAIIVFHEFDKLTHYNLENVGNNGKDMDTDMMRDIMRFFETGHSLHLENGVDPQNFSARSYKLPVDNLMFVFDGAFSGMEDIIRKRLNIGRTIGFNQSYDERCSEDNLLKHIAYEDLLEWGYNPELLGRLGEYIVLNPLTTEVIYEIMTSAKDNILQEHIDFCQKNNIDLQFEDDAIHYIAEKAHRSGLGFRNVKALLSKALNRLYFEIEENAETRKVVKVSKELLMTAINYNYI